MLPSQEVFYMEIIVASLRKQMDTSLSYRCKSDSKACLMAATGRRHHWYSLFPAEAEIYLLFTVPVLGPVIIRRPMHWAVGREATAEGHIPLHLLSRSRGRGDTQYFLFLINLYF